jgi:hypothetical protein
MNASIDPDYYNSENSGYWIKSPTYEWDRRYIGACEKACNLHIACWLPQYEPDIPW